MAHCGLKLIANLAGRLPPITQNGCVRILAQPKYPNSIPSTDAIHVLRNYSDTAIIGALSPAEWSRSGMGLQKLAILLGHSDIKIHDAVRTHGAAERRHRGS